MPDTGEREENTMNNTAKMIEMLTNLQELKRMKDELEAEIKKASADIIADLGQDDVVGAIYGPYKVTCKEETRRTIDGESFRKDLPELADKYTKVSVSRPLRVR